MWALPLPLVAIVTCVAIALRHTRWSDLSLRVSRGTYAVVFPLSLLYFPAQSGFHVHAVQCEWTFDLALAIYSLGNFHHLVGFTIFFLLTFAQIAKVRYAIAWAFAACFVLGFLVEMAEGATSIHHCRMRDMIPDMAGAVIGATVIAVYAALTKRD